MMWHVIDVIEWVSFAFGSCILHEGCSERAAIADSGLALPLGADSAFLSRSFCRMAWGAARSPQGRIPKDLLVTSMRHAMVDHGCRCHASFLLAVPAQRELGEMPKASTLPLPTVPTLRGGQPFAPCVRVQHLHSLRADLTRSCGLHGDPGLSHLSVRREASG
jgi:hypothetical protein